MKKILKTLFIILAAVCVFITTNKSDAATFTILDLGEGKSIISQNYMTFDNSSGVYVVKTTGAFEMKKGEVFAVYGSYSFVGDITKTTGVSYRIYNQAGSYKDYNSKWQVGGWYGTAFLENTTGSDGYIEILDFGVPYGVWADDVVEEVEVRRTSAVGVFNFDGYRVCYVGKEYYLADDSYTLVLPDNIQLTDEEILQNFKSQDYSGNITISIKSNNYKKEAGNYTVTIEAKDVYNNVTSYDLNILVYATETPSIIGQDQIYLYLSEFSNFSQENLLNMYSGSYYGYSYNLSLDTSYLNSFYNHYALCDDTELKIDCEFSDGTKISKIIKIYVLDDVAPELFIKKVVYLTEYINSLSIGEIITLINGGLSAQNIEAENISLIGVDTLPSEAGTYTLNFAYEENGEKKVGELNLVLKDYYNADTYVSTILNKTENIKSFNNTSLIQMIEKELLNKGINASNIIITSDEDSISANEGEYEITFTYDEGNVTQNGTLTLTLTDIEDSTEINSNTKYYVIGIISVVLIGVCLIAYKKKRQHM